MSAFPGIYDVSCPYCLVTTGHECVSSSGKRRGRHDPHAARWGRLRQYRMSREFVVRILKTDERLGVKEGEEYEAVTYPFDPGAKVSLLRRIPDGYDPQCNQYWNDAEFVRWATR